MTPTIALPLIGVISFALGFFVASVFLWRPYANYLLRSLNAYRVRDGLEPLKYIR